MAEDEAAGAEAVVEAELKPVTGMCKPCTQKSNVPSLSVSQKNLQKSALASETDSLTHVSSIIDQRAVTLLHKLGLTPVQVENKRGGRLSAYIQNWRIVTHDPWILEVVEGKPISWL